MVGHAGHHYWAACSYNLILRLIEPTSGDSDGGPTTYHRGMRLLFNGRPEEDSSQQGLEPDKSDRPRLSSFLGLSCTTLISPHRHSEGSRCG